MKNSIFQITAAMICLAMLMLSCKDNTPSVQEKTEALLVSTAWSKPTLIVDGVDHSDLYPNLTIKFSKNSYTSSGGSPVWPASGSWAFKNESATAMILDGTTEAQLTEVTETDLEIAVQWTNTTFASGRLESVSGKNIFHFKKK